MLEGSAFDDWIFDIEEQFISPILLGQYNSNIKFQFSNFKYPAASCLDLQ